MLTELNPLTAPSPVRGRERGRTGSRARDRWRDRRQRRPWPPIR